jgi:heme exporter protein A
MLSIINLSFARNGLSLFSNLTLNLNEGDLLNIYGNNGSGKTTLIKLIAMLLLPDQGQIKYNTRAIIYLGHRANYHPALTAIENLKYINGLSSENTNTYDAALKYFKLFNYKDCQVANLSCGQVKKLVLCRLFNTSETIWLLDEPFANLDFEGQELLVNLIQEKLKNNGLVIFTSHSENAQSKLQPKLLNLDAVC